MTRVIRADRAGDAVIPRDVADAHAEARAIALRTRAEAERGREAALASARAEARAELAAQWIALAEESDRRLAAQQPQLVELGKLLAQRILGEELNLAPERIEALAAPLLARVRRAHKVTLRVHPDDRAWLASRLPALRASAELAGALQVEADPELARGDCVLLSDAGALDARIETQLRALGKALGVE